MVLKGLLLNCLLNNHTKLHKGIHKLLIAMLCHMDALVYNQYQLLEDAKAMGHTRRPV